MSRQVIRTKNFVSDAANFILDRAHRALSERNEFRVALSGGNTPRPIYAEVARKDLALPWNRTVITFGDERCVPPDNDQSNYKMAFETLLQPAHVPDKSVLRLRGESDPAAAAQEYDDKLKA